MTHHFIIYKTIHPNGKFYIGRHQTNNLNDGYFGSGHWVKSIKDKTSLSREILAEATTLEDLVVMEEYFIKIHYNNELCMNMKMGSDGYTSEDVTGDKHFNYDHQEYHFIHSDGREFIGTKYNFRTSFNINSGQLSELFNGNVASAKGWRIFGNTESSVLKRRMLIHHFINVNGEEFIGTRRDFLKTYPAIKRQYIDSLISGNGKSAHGWKLIGGNNLVKSINDYEIYHFINKDGREFIGSSLDFRKTHKINQGNLSRLINGDETINTIKGWYIRIEEKSWHA